MTQYLILNCKKIRIAVQDVENTLMAMLLTLYIIISREKLSHQRKFAVSLRTLVLTVHILLLTLMYVH